MHTRYWWGNLEEIGHLECTGVDGRIILKRTLRTEDWAVNWIDLVQDRAPQHAVKKRTSCVKFLD